MIITSQWLESLFEKKPKEAWTEIFTHIERQVPLSFSDIKSHYQEIEGNIARLDEVLQSSAWDLWQEFKDAPRGSDHVKTFWEKTIGPKAVLILDSVSMREVAPILAQIKHIGAEVKSVHFAGSELPSETEIYAAALGLPGRFSLKNRPLPGSFKLNCDETFVDTFKKIPFDESDSKIPNHKNVFLWHGWPDDTLHDLGKVEDAFNRFIDHVRESLDSDGFRGLLKKMSKGRELLITSDHGYCNASAFTPANGEQHKELKQLGHTRAKAIKESERVAGMTIPPVTLELNATATGDLYKLAVGRWRPSDKGFPALTHGGLSLMECVVPLIHVRGISNV
jgi:hypothetical protein